MVKLLGADLDGTCLSTNVELLPETKEALEKAIEMGVIVVPTTGRTLSIVPEDVKNIKGLKYIITSSGAVIQDAKTGEILYSQDIPEVALKKILEILNDYDLFLEIYAEGTDYINENSLKRLGEFIPDSAYWDLFLNDATPIPEEEFKKLPFTKPIEKINFRVSPKDLEKRPEIFNRLQTIPGLDIIDQAEGNGEITNEDANKGEALAALANRYGIDCTEVMAIGDSNNDISMLTFADIGVAMGQAEDIVKEKANFVTESNDNNGVALAIKKFIIEAEPEPSLMPEDLAEKVRKVNKF